jgi:hypothetical protein
MATEIPAEEGTTRPAGLGSWGKEVLLAAFASMLFFAAFLAVPVLGALALPAVSVPPTRLAFRRGAGAGALASVLCAGVLLGLGVATGPAGDAAALAFFAAVVTALPGLFAGAVRRGRDASRSYLVLCAAGFAVLGAGLALRPAAGGKTMRQEIATAFDEMAPVAVQSYTRGGMDAESIARLKTTLASARDFAEKFWVGLLGASWILASAIGFYAGARLARPEAGAEAARFDRFSVPAGVVALFVAAGAGTVLAPSPARQIAGNALLPLAALYFLAGLSIICHFARKWFRAWILRVGLYGLALYFPINLGVGLLGLFDWYADFRHRGEKA